MEQTPTGHQNGIRLNSDKSEMPSVVPSSTPDLTRVSSVVDATDMLKLVQESENDPDKLKAAFSQIQSREEQQSFLTFLTDQEIIDAGIVKNLQELIDKFPNLRY